MKNQNLKTLNDLINKGTILTAEQVEQFLTTILDFLAKNKKEFDVESSERLSEMKEVMKYIEVQHKEILADWEAKLDTKTSEVYNKVKNGFDKEITKAKEIIQELRSIKLRDGVDGKDGEPGKDADETKIVAKVLKKLPKSKDYSAVGIKDMLESLEDDDRLDFGVLKNVPNFNPIMAGAGGRLLSQMNDVNVTGLTNNSILKYNTTTSQWEVGAASGTGTVTSIATGTGLTGGTITTSGTIALSTPLQPIASLTGNALKVLRVNAGESAVEYASVGAGTVTSVSGTADRITVATGTTTPVIDIAATYAGQTSITTLGTITTGTWSGSSIALNKITALTASRAVVSDGSGFLTSATTTATEIGYVNGVTSAIQTQLNAKAAALSGTANEIAYFNTTTTIASLTTATYPSLTELSYVKGVTSAIQTQLNAKGTGTVTSVGWTGGIVSIATATTTPAFTIAGTSGGIPYFSSASTWATSAALTANALVIGGGAGAAPATTTTGTGVLTALGINVGSAGAFVTFNGALGTPSSGTVTNLTGTASININGTVGATTPTTGVFTTLVAGSTTSLLLGTAGSAVGNIGFRNATSGTITLAPATGALGTVTLTLPAATDTLVGKATTDTLTNKRPQPRTASSTTASTLTPDLSSANVYYRTTQTATLTINAPTGTPVIGETIAIYVDSAGAQTLTIDSTYKVFGAAFPATTTAGKTFMLTAQYNGTDWKTLWANAV